MGEIGNTQFFKVDVEKETSVKIILEMVFEAMQEKGYDPVNQIVGYIMSGDPTYITSHNNARSMIQKVERDELVEELLTEYIKKKRTNCDRHSHALRNSSKKTMSKGSF